MSVTIKKIELFFVFQIENSYLKIKLSVIIILFILYSK